MKTLKDLLCLWLPFFAVLVLGSFCQRQRSAPKINNVVSVIVPMSTITGANGVTSTPVTTRTPPPPIVYVPQLTTPKIEIEPTATEYDATPYPTNTPPPTGVWPTVAPSADPQWYPTSTPPAKATRMHDLNDLRNIVPTGANGLMKPECIVYEFGMRLTGGCWLHVLELNGIPDRSLSYKGQVEQIFEWSSIWNCESGKTFSPFMYGDYGDSIGGMQISMVWNREWLTSTKVKIEVYNNNFTVPDIITVADLYNPYIAVAVALKVKERRGDGWGGWSCIHELLDRKFAYAHFNDDWEWWHIRFGSHWFERDLCSLTGMSVEAVCQ